MVSWEIYEFLDSRKDGVITEWLRREKIPKRSRALLDQKLDQLRLHGPDLPPNLLSSGPIDGGHILKLKVRADVMLRPLLCRGPFRKDQEFTLLRGAIERNGVLPDSDVRAAEQNRIELIAQRTRRQLYESSSETPKE